MTLRSTLAAASGAGLLAVLPALATASGQETVTIEEHAVVQEDRERGPGRGESADQATVERLRRELEDMRRALETERVLRLRVQEQLFESVERGARERRERDEAREADRREGDERIERGEVIEEIEVDVDSPRAQPIDRGAHEESEDEGRDDEPAEGRGRESRDAPGEVEVAEARVEAARARVEAGEVRVDVSRQKLEITERLVQSARVQPSELLEIRGTIAEAQAHLAEARAQLVEAEFHLAQVRGQGEGDDDCEDEEDDDEGEEIEVEDVLNTAERIIDLIRRFEDDFEDDDRGNREDEDDDLEESRHESGSREHAIDEVVNTADDIISLIQRFRRERVGR